tara:strand:+ start:98 stop:367 length:270 start_codon:yes stop_codon:yes gene_type:complete
MTSEPLNQKVSERICKHMNSDHLEALLAYAIDYGSVEDPKAARMMEINSKEMKLDVDGKVVNIIFDHELKDSQDAHKTLVAMLRKQSNQ